MIRYELDMVYSYSDPRIFENLDKYGIEIYRVFSRKLGKLP